MKILIVMPSGVFRGGAEEALLHLAQAHREAGLTLHVIFLEPGDLAERVAAEGVPVETFDAGRLRQPIRYLQTVSHLAKRLRSERPDAVLSWMTKGHLYAAPAAQWTGVPALYWQMGLPDGGVVDRWVRRLPAAGAIGCSAFVAERQQALVAHRVVPVLLAADPARFDPELLPSPTACREQLGFDPARPLVGVVARWQEWKGLIPFARAFALLQREVPECQGVIVGGPHHLEPDYPARLQHEIATLGLSDTLRLAGPQPNVPDWMQAMDVVLHTSREEPLGIVVLEAMRLGKPVIATVPGGPEELIAPEQEGLLVPFDDPPALARAMMRFLREPAFAAACGTAAKARAAAFTPLQMALHLRAALKPVVAEAKQD